MKKCIFIFSCFLAILTFSCNKGSKQTTEGGNSSLFGKWILVESLLDPGDGSGKWTAVDKPNYYYLQLESDSSVESNVYIGLNNARRFTVVNDSVMTFTFGGGETNKYAYRLGADNSSLTITGGCFEPCGSKFVRGR